MKRCYVEVVHAAWRRNAEFDVQLYWPRFRGDLLGVGDVIIKRLLLLIGKRSAVFAGEEHIDALNRFFFR